MGGLDDDVGDGVTLGVEEEFLLVDARTRITVPRAAAVLARVPAPDGLTSDGGLRAELLSTQVEAVTGVCTALGTLRAQLWRGRHRLAAAARAEDARLISSGGPVLPGRRLR